MRNVTTRKKGKIRKATLQENLEMLLMVLPGVLLVFTFNYLPLPGIIVAFKKLNPIKGIFQSPWNGLKNFEFFFTSQDAVRTIVNTVVYNCAFLILDLITAVGLALMLYFLKSRRATKVYNTIVILPKFMSMVIISYIVYAFLSPSYGIFNHVLEGLGLESVNWYTEPKYWPFILTFVHIWQVVGINSVLYYASLMGMDACYIEAAKIDGADLKQQIRYVMIPHLIPTISVVTILAIGHMFSSGLDLFYQVPRNQGILYSTTDTINTYVYRALLDGSLEKSTAVNLFQSAVGFVLVVTANKIVKKISPENSLF